MKMKDKQAGQIKTKKKHREALKAQRRKQPSFTRDEPDREEIPTILIVCEGKNTEPSYFKQFKLSLATIVTVGEGYNTIALVKRAIQLSRQKQYDQVWCVFDADPKPDNPKQTDNFNEAVRLARQNNLMAAYSNQAFEYWLILHFLDHQGGKMHRSDYHKKIKSLLKPFKVEYDGTGSKIITETLFDLLQAVPPKGTRTRQEIAIERAHRNHKSFVNQKPSAEESNTCVYLLVKELMKYV